MKVGDLRIGNWVMGNKPFQLTFNDFGRIHAHLMATGQMRFEPIPLTEDWLVRFGYNREADRDGYDYWHKDSDYHIWVRGRNFTFYNDQLSPFYGHTIEFVHQIQNLFQSLEGKELELKQ